MTKKWTWPAVKELNNELTYGVEALYLALHLRLGLEVEIGKLMSSSPVVPSFTPYSDHSTEHPLLASHLYTPDDCYHEMSGLRPGVLAKQPIHLVLREWGSSSMLLTITPQSHSVTPDHPYSIHCSTFPLYLRPWLKRTHSYVYPDVISRIPKLWGLRADTLTMAERAWKRVLLCEEQQRRSGDTNTLTSTPGHTPKIGLTPFGRRNLVSGAAFYGPLLPLCVVDALGMLVVGCGWIVGLGLGLEDGTVMNKGR
ncbi:hypothetical protein BJ165DRAFT_1410647 [Panaeolus papilionaceus]|nr:hypothetical protein BJ165DRAFT_1410647 [Panaeolus papilionaceus]